MQIPERLALIGGGILLSSLLVFTLKSQVSNLLPKISGPISSIYDHAGDTQNGSFNSDFKDAQHAGRQTGTWGTAKFYIDKDMNMYIGSGQLQGPLYDAIGSQAAHSIKTINLEGDAQAPANSANLFTGRDGSGDPNHDSNHSIVSINGLERLDTSHAVSMVDMFYHDNALSNDLAISNWDTSNVTDMTGMFGQTNLSKLNIKNWDVRKVFNIAWAFTGDSSLQGLDLSGWHTDNLTSSAEVFSTGDTSLQGLNLSNFNTTNADIDYFLGGSANWDVSPNNLTSITLGDKSSLKTTLGLSGTWKSGDQILKGSDLSSSGMNGQPAHPGTWVRQ